MCPSALVKLICTGISSPFLLCVSTFTVDASGQLTNLDLETAANPFKYEFLRDNSNIADAIIELDHQHHMISLEFKDLE